MSSIKMAACIVVYALAAAIMAVYLCGVAGDAGANIRSRYWASRY